MIPCMQRARAGARQPASLHVIRVISNTSLRSCRSSSRKLPMQEFTALDGAILIDKPARPTSHDVVDAIRRKFGIKKVGHCGTLDPNATGLLIIVLGRGTKLSERL